MSESPTPWFHHFWPWFIVALLGISVLGSLTTVAIAYRYGDVEVLRTSDPMSPALRAGGPDDGQAAGKQNADRTLP
jgi:hypothetical protein